MWVSGMTTDSFRVTWISEFSNPHTALLCLRFSNEKEMLMEKDMMKVAAATTNTWVIILFGLIDK